MLSTASLDVVEIGGSVCAERVEAQGFALASLHADTLAAAGVAVEVTIQGAPSADFIMLGGGYLNTPGAFLSVYLEGSKPQGKLLTTDESCIFTNWRRP